MREPEAGISKNRLPAFFLCAYLCYWVLLRLASGVGKLGDKTVVYDMHIGNLIREKLNEEQKSVIWLAHELSCSRTNVYKIFSKSSIDTHVLMHISQILHFNFFQLYSDEYNQHDKK